MDPVSPQPGRPRDEVVRPAGNGQQHAARLEAAVVAPRSAEPPAVPVGPDLAAPAGAPAEPPVQPAVEPAPVEPAAIEPVGVVAPPVSVPPAVAAPPVGRSEPVPGSRSARAGRSAGLEPGRHEPGRNRRRHAAAAPPAVAGGFPAVRPRRLRRSPAIRELFTHTRLSAADLVLPLFVKEGLDEPVPVRSMPGVMQHSVESLRKTAAAAVSAGIGGLILFGIPQHKDALGTQADAEDGVLLEALRGLRTDLGDDTVIMTDLCLCEYTDHGHCGPLTPAGQVDNDATLQRYAEVAAAQAAAGAHVVAPSGMMDGQVAAIRAGLDDAEFTDVPILAYSTKYASSFYGPFREAAEGAPQFGDRAAYQQDPARSVGEALREVELDLAEGADAVMVKPALAYLDVLSAIAAKVSVPVAAYQVSGEYAMVEAAAAAGVIDRRRAVLETLTAIRRAGADVVLSYWAVEVADWLR